MCFFKRKPKPDNSIKRAANDAMHEDTNSNTDVMDRSLQTKSFNRAKGINKGEINAGSPHDWEDLDNYLLRQNSDKNKKR